MAYDMKVVREDDYLHVIVTGDNTPADVASYLDQIRRICVERDFPKVLIEEDLAGPPFRTADIYDVVSGASVGTAPGVRHIAFVDVNPDHAFADMEFAETVAVNRGVNVKVFRDVASATEWIRRQ